MLYSYSRTPVARSTSALCRDKLQQLTYRCWTTWQVRRRTKKKSEKNEKIKQTDGSDKFDARVMEAGDEIGAGEVGWVLARVPRRDKLACSDTVVDRYQPVTSCTGKQ